MYGSVLIFLLTGRNKVGKSKISDKIYYVYRIVAMLLFVLIFLPAVNPARISGMVNRSISLLTAGFSYGTLIDNFGRAFRKEWILESTMRLDNISSLLVCIGIFA
jgi:putative aldouronate transport system permease protein